MWERTDKPPRCAHQCSALFTAVIRVECNATKIAHWTPLPLSLIISYNFSRKSDLRHCAKSEELCFTQMSSPINVSYITPGAMIAVAVLFPVLSMVCVGLRVYTRCVQKASILADDWLLVPAVVRSLSL